MFKVIYVRDLWVPPERTCIYFNLPVTLPQSLCKLNLQGLVRSIVFPRTCSYMFGIRETVPHIALSMRTTFDLENLVICRRHLPKAQHKCYYYWCSSFLPMCSPYPLWVGRGSQGFLVEILRRSMPLHILNFRIVLAAPLLKFVLIYCVLQYSHAHI